MGGYGMGGMRGNGQEESLFDRVFMVVERMNYQIYHFCQMATMIQAQSASLAFFFETVMKIYRWLKEFVMKHANNTYTSTKLYFLKKLQEIKTFFLNLINFIDRMIKYLVISSTAAFIFTYLTSK